MAINEYSRLVVDGDVDLVAHIECAAEHCSRERRLT
jgi:hypothetical protein